MGADAAPGGVDTLPPAYSALDENRTDNSAVPCRCGTQVRDEDAFCRKCGVAALRCSDSTCGARLVPGDTFCGMCGTQVEGEDDVEAKDDNSNVIQSLDDIPLDGYSTCATATLKLVPKGSSHACWLEKPLTRRNSQMVLKNGMAIGPKWKNTRNAFGQWDYIDLGVGTYASDSIQVHLNESGFIVWNCKHGEMVFDISMWKLQEGTNLVLVKGVGTKSNNTMNHEDNRGRLFMQVCCRMLQ